MTEISKKILEKAKKLIKEGRVIKDIENDKRIHFKVWGDSEEYIVIYDKFKNTYNCDCSWATLRNKLCSHALACKILLNSYNPNEKNKKVSNSI
jgi:hypothetical protein